MGWFAILTTRPSTGSDAAAAQAKRAPSTKLIGESWRSKWWIAGALLLASGASVLKLSNANGTVTPPVELNGPTNGAGGNSCLGTNLSPLRFLDLVVADMDRDKRSDLVVAISDPGATAVVILHNPGDATPVACWPHVNLDAKDLSVPRLAVGDLDHDGYLDVVAASFDRRILHWWLLGSAGIKGSNQLAVDDPESSGHAPNHQLKLSSLALADVDADGDLDLAVVGMRHDDEAALTRVYSYGPGNQFTKQREWKTRSALRTRFVDLDGDGALELVNSVYSLRHPVKAPVTSGDALVWAEALSLVSADAAPLQLSAQFDAPLLKEPPRAAVVDFDVVGTGSTKRFALALSGHHCEPANCWDKDTQGGFVQVVNSGGKVLWSSARAELKAEDQASAEAGKALRFVPSKLRFLGTASAPALVIGYWLTFPQDEETKCTKARPCAGPLFIAPSLEQEPSRVGQDAFLIQGLGLPRSASAAPRQHCAAPLGRLVSLPDHNIESIETVGADHGALRFSWVPDTDFVQLDELPEAPSSPVCVRYLVASANEIAVADQKAGLAIVSINE